MDNKIRTLFYFIILSVLITQCITSHKEGKKNKPQSDSVPDPGTPMNRTSLIWIPDTSIILGGNTNEYFGSEKVEDIGDIKKFLTKIVTGKLEQIKDKGEFVGVSLKTKKKGKIFYLKKEYVGKQPDNKQKKDMKDFVIDDPEKNNVGLYIFPTTSSSPWLKHSMKRADALRFQLMI
mgnify:CR=1 FL=1